VILVDTSVLLDVLTADPAWLHWSETQLEAARLRGRVAVNDIVYAELSVRAARMEDVDAALQGLDIEVPCDAAGGPVHGRQGVRPVSGARRCEFRSAS
jgi:predicted nucleic acid-binding protein